MLFGRDKGKKNRHEEKIEVILTERSIVVRLVFMVLALIVAAVSFYYIFTKVLHTEGGWQTVTAQTKSGVGSEFAFHYEFGVSDISASQEWGKINKLYPILLDKGAEIFGSEQKKGVGNLYQLNAYPNEEVSLEPQLYEALQKIEKQESRFIYYSPVFAQYNSLFACEDDYAASNFDPFVNEEVAEYIEHICNFAKSKEHIHLELLDNYKAKLVVSDTYLAFAKENEIDKFIDLYYVRNAFILDYTATQLMENGYTSGVITTIEGFTRSLGKGDYTVKYYVMNNNNLPEGKVYNFGGPSSVVSIRNFPLYGEQNKYFYQTEENDIRHIFVDYENGLSIDKKNQLLGNSEKIGCGEMFIILYDEFCSGVSGIVNIP